MFWFLVLVLLFSCSCRTEEQKIGSAIVQYGPPKTGTTVQFAILCSIAKLKNKGGAGCHFSNRPTIPKSPTTQVLKTHSCFGAQKAEKEGADIFVTSPTNNCEFQRPPKVIQDSKTYFRLGFPYLSNQIETEYKQLFSLSNNETAILIEFLKSWEPVGRCCESQMARDYLKYLGDSGLWKKPVNPASLSPPITSRSDDFCLSQSPNQFDSDHLKSMVIVQKFGIADFAYSLLWCVWEAKKDASDLMYPSH